MTSQETWALLALGWKDFCFVSVVKTLPVAMDTKTDYCIWSLATIIFGSLSGPIEGYCTINWIIVGFYFCAVSVVIIQIFRLVNRLDFMGLHFKTMDQLKHTVTITKTNKEE